MGAQSALAVLAIAGLATVLPVRADAQSHGGGGRGGGHTAHASRAAAQSAGSRQARTAAKLGSLSTFFHGPRFTQPFGRFETPPFPFISTLSGPLPDTFGPPLPNDQFRVRGRFNTTPLYYPGFFYGGYGAPEDDDTAAESSQAPPAPQPASGLLRLDVTPLSAQVYIDGYYAGTVEDIDNQRGLILPEGPHRLELRARGYSSDAANVNIAARDALTYRNTLDLVRPQAPPAPASAAAATMYVIPGCYIGNVPPRRDHVQAGCDVAKVQVEKPK